MDKKWMRELQETTAQWKQMRKVAALCRWVSQGAACQNPTVGSHAIQKSGGLLRVSEGGIVITWDLAGPKGLKFKKTPIGTASVFPGYCLTHEKIFERMENRGYILGAQEEIEQLFRSIDLTAYEIEAGRDTFGEKVLDVYNRALAGEEGLNLLHSHKLNEQFNDKHIALRCLNEMRSSIQTSYDRGKYYDVQMLSRTFKEETPICFVGFETFKTGLGRMPLVVCVFPERGQTRVIVASTNKSLFGHYFKEHLKHWKPDVWKRSIKWWMTYGTDNWYLNPEVFRRWSEEDKQKFQTEAEKQGGAALDTPASVKLWEEDFKSLPEA